MTNEELEERANKFVEDFAKEYDPFDYMSGAAHEGTVIRLVELLTQVRNEAIEEAKNLVKNFICQEHEDTDLCEHYCTGQKVLAKAIEALKDGAK